MRLGFHVSIAGGLDLAVERAVSVGCRTMQIFTHSPRIWKFPILSDDTIARFVAARAASDIRPVFVHTSYLINLATSDEELFAKSIGALRQELVVADAIGAEYVVTHVGSTHTEDRTQVAARVAEGIRETHRGLRLSTKLLLENTACERGDAGCRFEEIAEMINLSGIEGIGVTVDTCHSLGAGYDFITAEGIADTIGEIEATFGLERVKLIHLNDSKHPLGSHRDRHQDIGTGYIGAEGMRRILTHPKLRDIPFVMETPKSGPEDDMRNMAVALRLAGIE